MLMKLYIQFKLLDNVYTKHIYRPIYIIGLVHGLKTFMIFTNKHNVFLVIELKYLKNSFENKTFVIMAKMIHFLKLNQNTRSVEDNVK